MTINITEKIKTDPNPKTPGFELVVYTWHNPHNDVVFEKRTLEKNQMNKKMHTFFPFFG